jgi:surfactin synthase thioesterase subunit
MPADVEVLAIQLPGREARLAEPHLTDYGQAVAQLFAAIRPLLDRPYTLFGHSMGALLAYGIAMAAPRGGALAPDRLIVSGCPGPGSAPRKPGRAKWSEAELIEDLREMGGTPEEVLDNSGLLELILPTLRADYAIYESFRRPTGPELECPLSVLGGEDDSVSVADLERWADTTRADSSVRLFPGGHFFLTGQSAEAVFAAVTADLGVDPA